MSGAGRLAAGLALILVWLVPVSGYLAVPWIVSGASMEPTLLEGERVIVDRWTYERRAPRPGEIALIQAPDGRTLIKRVSRAHGTQLWVLGDNPAASDDSRRFGPIGLGRVRGRVVARYWPPSRAGRLGSAARATLPAR